MKRIAVFGGSGFTGSCLVRHLLSTGCSVLSVDRADKFAHSAAGMDSGLLHNLRLHVTADSSGLVDAMSEHHVECIINCMNIPASERSSSHSEPYCRYISASNNLAQAAATYFSGSDKNIESFKYISIYPYGVYGSLEADGTFDERSPYNPSTLYTAAAAAAAMLLVAWHKEHNLPAVTVIASGIYGASKTGDSTNLVNYAVNRVFEGKNIILNSHGKYTRDWIYIKDFCSAITSIIGSGQPGEKYCVGSGQEISIIDAIDLILSTINSMKIGINADPGKLVKFGGGNATYDKRRVLNCNKIQKTMGFEPQYDFSSGIKDFIDEYMRNNLDFLSPT